MENINLSIILKLYQKLNPYKIVIAKMPIGDFGYAYQDINIILFNDIESVYSNIVEGVTKLKDNIYDVYAIKTDEPVIASDIRNKTLIKAIYRHGGFSYTFEDEKIFNLTINHILENGKREKIRIKNEKIQRKREKLLIQLEKTINLCPEFPEELLDYTEEKDYTSEKDLIIGLPDCYFF